MTHMYQKTCYPLRLIMHFNMNSPSGIRNQGEILLYWVKSRFFAEFSVVLKHKDTFCVVVMKFLNVLPAPLLAAE